MLQDLPIVPWSIAGPLAALAVCLVGLHLYLIGHSGAPASTRRIRTANGLVMLVLIPALACGLSLVHKGSAGEARVFVLTWMLIVGLVGIVLGLALIDLMNNLRLTVKTRRLRNQLAAEHLALAAMHVAMVRAGKR